ncbi:MAG: hypothetical protein LBJ02_10980 [Bifidobacteriaceae bacterium]|jgi:hypothetical protein|nr:hypothetical protein [Bifidobacteriaceae bacterium]
MTPPDRATADQLGRELQLWPPPVRALVVKAGVDGGCWTEDTGRAALCFTQLVTCSQGRFVSADPAASRELDRYCLRDWQRRSRHVKPGPTKAEWLGALVQEWPELWRVAVGRLGIARCGWTPEQAAWYLGVPAHLVTPATVGEA